MQASRIVAIVAFLAVVAPANSWSLAKDHCLSPAGDNRCEICEEGFFVDPDTGDCHQQGLPGCLVYERNRNACLEWAGEGGVAARALQTACPSLQYPLNGACVPLTYPVGCATSSGTADKCDVCQDLYYLVNSETCTPGTVDNCAKYSPAASTCITCASGYYVISGMCLKQSVANCLAYDPNVNQCVQCGSPYVVLNGLCVFSRQANCQNFTDATKSCQQCNSLFYPRSGVCVAITSANCATSDGLVNACSTCKAGFYLTSTKVCATQNIASCLTYVPQQNACQTCAAGLRPSGSLCVVDKSLNCATYDAATNTCSLCNSLFYVSYGRCLKLTIANCLISGGITNTCTICASGYYRVTSGGCSRQSVTNCVAYAPNSNTCTKCSGTLIVWLKMCVVNNGLNCQTYTPASNKCSLCNNRYYLFGNGCAPVTDVNCKTSNGVNNTCLVCASGSYMNEKMICEGGNITGCEKYVEEKNECSVCGSLYTLSGTTCLLTVPGCVGYNADRSLCAKCDSLKYLAADKLSCPAVTAANCQNSDGVANVCATCASGFYLTAELTCISISDPNCASSDGKANVCVTCLSGFFLKNNQICVPEAPFCITLASADKSLCAACLPGYALATNPGNCAPVVADPNCLFFELGSCSVCAQGYFSDGSATCQKIPIERCLVYRVVNNENVCLECESGYKPVHIGTYYAPTVDRCVPEAIMTTGLSPLAPVPTTKVCAQGMYLDANSNCVFLSDKWCAFGDGIRDVCIGCRAFYQMVNGVCVSMDIPNCGINLLNENKCAECNWGYYVHPTTRLCISGQVPYCTVHDQRFYKCLVCNSRYHLTTDGLCRTIVASDCAPGKFVDASPPFCTGCNNRYVLSQGSCVRDSAECIQTDAASTGCIQTCPSGQYFDEATNACAIRTDTNCEVFLPWSNSCKTCKLGYNLDSNNACVPIKDPNCLKVDEPLKYCVRCTPESGLWPSSAVCTALPNCGYLNIRLDENIGCTSCTQGYKFDIYDHCVPHDYQAYMFPLSGMPPTCRPGATNTYSYDVTQTCQKIANCRDNVADTATCVNCEAGYYLLNGVCTKSAISGCARWATDVDSCLTCNPEFYLTQLGVCAPKTVKGCATTVPSANVCATCPSGFYLTAQLTCAAQNLTGCVTYVANKNECSVCRSLHTLSGTTCLLTVPGCVGYNADRSLCAKCESLKYLAADKLSCPAVTAANCQNSDGVANACAVCASDFYLTAELTCAAQNVPNCVTYVANKNECSVCGSLYTLSGTTCLLTVPGCAEYNADRSLCAKCESLKYLAADKLSCPAVTAANCQNSDGVANVCATCASGFYLTAELTCISISDPNCASSDGKANVCVTCLSGFFLKNNQICVPEAPFCITLASADKSLCAACLPGYALATNPGNCAPVVADPNCLFFELGSCSVCAQGYFSDGSATCQKIPIERCLVYRVVNNENVCLECESGYKPVHIGTYYAPTVDRCVPEAIMTTGLSPLAPVPTTKVCAQGMYLDANSNCVFLSDKWCAFGDGIRDVCIGCRAFYQMVNGVCVSMDIPNCGINLLNENKCAECNWGYYVHPTTRLCISGQVPYCTVHDQRFYKCLVCNSRYHLTTDGLCRTIVASDCAPGKFVDASPPFCTGCNNRYVLSQGSCVRDSAECIQTDAASTGCIQTCPSGQYFDEATNACAIRTDTNCEVFLPWSNSCKTCKLGYNLDSNNACVPIKDPNCLKVDEPLKYCVRCTPESGLWPSSAVCTALPNCGYLNIRLDENIGCTSCTQGYKFDIYDHCVPHDYQAYMFPLSGMPPTCRPGATNTYSYDVTQTCQKIANCRDNVADTATCVNCEAGYYLLNGVCTKSAISGCARWATDVDSCLTCNPEFYLTQLGVCAPKTVKGCATTVPSANVCATCPSGFYLTAQLTCAAQNLTGCVTYVANKNECSVCGSLHTLSGTTCLLTVPGCVGYNADRSLCAKCESLKYLAADNLSCPAVTAANCLNSDGVANACAVCASDFYLTAELTCAAQNVPNCVTYVANKNECSVCGSLYTLSGTTCLLTVPGCVGYNADRSLCAKCESLKYLAADKLSCPAVTAANCQNSDGVANVCATCASGFYLTAELTCISISDPNCASSDGKANVCVTCLSGFFLKNNQICVPEAPFCITLASADKSLCAACLPGYALATNPGNCAPVVADPNCLFFELGSCSVCAQGYFSDGSATCQKIPIERCLVYRVVNNENVCLECESGYKPVHIGTYYAPTVDRCVPEAIMTTGLSPLAPVPTTKVCAQGMYLDANSNCVFLSDKWCAFGDGIRDVCIGCRAFYQMVNGVCVSMDIPNCGINLLNENKCAECNWGYYVHPTTRLCISGQVPYCTVHDQRFYKCLVCNSRYHLTTDGLCRTIVASDCAPGKFVDASPPFCTGCNNRYVLSQGSCVRDSAECIQTDAASTGCIQTCPSGQYFDEATNACAIRTDTNCEVFLPWSNSCKTCKLGYNLDSNNACVPIKDPNCLKVDEPLKYCVRCTPESGLWPSSAVCTALPNCGYLNIRLDENIGCTSCTQGYKFDIYDHCVPHDYQAYMFPLSGMPPTCRPGATNTYSYDVTQTCQKIANCRDNVADTATCVNCEAGYYLLNGVCTKSAISGCARWATDVDSCLTCNPEFYLTQLGVCAPKTVKGCATTVPSANVCATCPIGKTLSSGSCV